MCYLSKNEKFKKKKKFKMKTKHYVKLPFFEEEEIK